MDYKQKFKEYVKKYIHREGIDQLMDALEKTDFYTAPASTRYHDAFEGGLVYHSVMVFERMSHIKDIAKTYEPETVAIVGLFHDLCKIGYYTVELRNAKVNGKWDQVPYYAVKDQFPYGHGEKSVDLLRDFIKLTDDEKLAIRWHMGGFEPKESYGTLSEAFKTCPLALHLHVSDMYANYFDGKYEV